MLVAQADRRLELTRQLAGCLHDRRDPGKIRHQVRELLAQRVMESGLARSSDIALGLEDLELLTRDIQDSVMAIRAQPVKSVFQRMPRLVRELAQTLGKSEESSPRERGCSTGGAWAFAGDGVVPA